MPFIVFKEHGKWEDHEYTVLAWCRDEANARTACEAFAVKAAKKEQRQYKCMVEARALRKQDDWAFQRGFWVAISGGVSEVPSCADAENSVLFGFAFVREFALTTVG